MNFDLEANIVSWEITKGKIVRVHEFGNFLVHLSKSGKPILIEVLDASRFKTKLNKLETIKQVSEAFGN
jgi:hypothetical protein